MPEAMVKDPMIGQALDLEKLFLQNQMERYNYLLSYKAMRDAETNDETIRRAALAKGRAEGEAKGRAEGEAKGRAEGRAEGEAKGRAKGRAEGRAEGEAKGRAEGEAKGRAEGRAEGEAKGRAEGRAEGEAKGRVETARNLLRMGLEVSQISEATGLSPDEIEALRGRLN